MGCSVFGIRSGYEQPSYVLVETLSDQIEMRHSAPRLAVETTVDIPDYDEGRNAAFRPLFDYISGANRTNESVAMTAPAEAALTSVEVSMTVPVETSRAGGGGYADAILLTSRVHFRNCAATDRSKGSSH